LQELPSSNAAQSPLFWHWQVLAPPTQLPPEHASPWVQGSPSSQGALLLMDWQPLAGLHESVVQGLLSLQGTDPEPTHAPPEQTSVVVQALLSLQGLLLGSLITPMKGSHESVVQGLLSLLCTTAPLLQAPASHVSPAVQALLSLHGNALGV
jgi:hypothetical protein